MKDMEKELYEYLVNEFDILADNDEEEPLTEEGIKKTLEWLEGNGGGLYQVMDDYLMDAYKIANGEDK